MQAWMWCGLAAFTSAVGASLVAARRGSWAKAALAVALLNLLIAGMNSSAPFRGLLDPSYIGYRAGMLAADSSVAVFFTSGLVLVAASLAAVVAASNAVGRAMLLVVVVDGLFFLNEIVSFIRQLLTAHNFVIQFGEFLTIPSGVGMVVLLALQIPLLAATIWATRRVRLPRRQRLSA